MTTPCATGSWCSKADGPTVTSWVPSVIKVNLMHDGRADVLQLPDAGHPAAGPAPLAFRHYQRLEGTFAVPAGATVRSVQVTINAGGETRAQQTFSM